MKRKQHGVLLAGLLAIGLSACTTDKMGSDTASTAAAEPVTGVSYGTPPATAQTTPAPADTAIPAPDMPATPEQAMPPGPQTAALVPNSVVTLIEVVPRSADATGAGTMAGAAVGGTAPTSDRVYRVTVRMDDGSTRVITQEWAPTFRSGDRVNLTGGEIQRG